MKTLIDAIKQATNSPRNDGMLHFSSHLQHDRHTVLYYHHGYPNVWDKPWMNTLPLLQGTAIHEQIHTIMGEAHQPYASEVEISCNDFQYPWVGTADAYMEDESGNLMLVDYKTISGTSFGFLDGPKPEHIMQVSAYYHFGMPGVHSVGILYLPTTPDYKRRWPEPVFYYVTPLSEDTIVKRIEQVEYWIKAYADDPVMLPDFPVGEHEWKQNKKERRWELWYKPHYSTLFCPWKDQENDPCGCSTEKKMHIGNWYEYNGVEGLMVSDEAMLQEIDTCPGYQRLVNDEAVEEN
jgi:hypothetical protein